MGGILLDEDSEFAGLLARVVDQQAALSDTYERLQNARAQARSVMAADNAATNPMQMEHYVSYCLMQAVDLGRAMRPMLRGEDGALTIPIMALYPLVRAQIESASIAMWVIEPADRRARVKRRLQAAHDELIHERALTKSALLGRSTSEVNDLLRMEAKRRSGTSPTFEPSHWRTVSTLPSMRIRCRPGRRLFATPATPWGLGMTGLSWSGDWQVGSRTRPSAVARPCWSSRALTPPAMCSMEHCRLALSG